MNTAESSTNLIAMPGLAPHRDNVTSLFQQPRRLLDVCDVAKWLGVSKGWCGTTLQGAGSRGCSPSNWDHEKAKDYGNSAKRTFSNFYATAILDKAERQPGCQARII